LHQPPPVRIAPSGLWGGGRRRTRTGGGCPALGRVGGGRGWRGGSRAVAGGGVVGPGPERWVMVDVDKVASQLETMINQAGGGLLDAPAPAVLGSASQAQLEKDVKKILSDAGATPEDHPRIREALLAKLQRPLSVAEAATTTGACYFGPNESQC